MMKTKEVVNHIVDWLVDYTRQSGMQGFVVGVSGGIDSAVTSALVAQTGYPVTCVEMPIYQNTDQVTRAAQHIANLQVQHSNVSKVQVDLTPVFDAFIGALPNIADSEQRQMSLVNSRARLRMSTLYYFAALERKLVAGTGNKVEDFGVGFYTKYGDGGVDLSPIADLLKTEVYQLGEELGVHKAIMEAPPTDGLWGDDRTDEDQIGATYPELEWAMQQKEQGKGADNFTGRQKQVMEIFEKHHGANQHKMQPIPVCLIPNNLK